MTEDERFMRMAISEAEKAAAAGEIPVGAVVVANGQVIARAHNQTETLHDVTAHAEMLAITSAADYLGGKYLQGCSLYVTLEPCVMCAGAIGWAQIARLIYGASDERRGYSALAPKALHAKCEVKSGIYEEECSQMVAEFFQSKRK